LYAIVYKGYTKWFDKNVIEVDPKRETPAHTYMDGVEFFPTSSSILLGFQWKSIAALGPVVGPIVAIQWGWLPALLWILFGNIFIGWIHDYSSIMVSVRSEGSSFGPITYKTISPRARSVLLGYILFYLILIMAAFAYVVAGIFSPGKATPPEAMKASPVFVPVVVVLIIGVLSGYLVYKFKVNIVATTIIALIVMALGVWAGIEYPVLITTDWLASFEIWMFIILLITFIGAVTPIWVLTQPVNYLSFYLVYFGIIAMIVGTLIGAPDYVQSSFTTFYDPNITKAGPLWPLLFVTIACGAISGWHSLIGSSVTSKQLDKETDAAPIGAGSMLLEGILALVALTTVAILTPETIKGKTAGAIFVTGGSQLLSNVGFSAEIAKPYVALMLVILALTIMYLAVRIFRLVLAELVGGSFRNIYLSAFIICFIAYVLATPRFGATWTYIWVLFGGANQLMAGLALMIVTLWLRGQKKPAAFTGIPMAFMIATTIGALIWTVRSSYLKVADYIAAEAWDKAIGNTIGGTIGVILIILALFMIYEGYKSYRKVEEG
jgi:carbon starvation protein